MTTRAPEPTSIGLSLLHVLAAAGFVLLGLKGLLGGRPLVSVTVLGFLALGLFLLAMGALWFRTRVATTTIDAEGIRSPGVASLTWDQVRDADVRRLRNWPHLVLTPADDVRVPRGVVQARLSGGGLPTGAIGIPIGLADVEGVEAALREHRPRSVWDA